MRSQYLPAGYISFPIYIYIHMLCELLYSRTADAGSQLIYSQLSRCRSSSIPSAHFVKVPVYSMMSEIALRDVNNIPESEMRNGSSNNGNYRKPLVESTYEKFKETRKEKMCSLVDFPAQKDAIKSSEVEVTNSEVEYLESDHLTDVEDVEDCMKTLLLRLGSKDWVSVCNALNDVRRLSVYHKEAIVGILIDVISLVVKSMKNPRSALCKTAVMTSADIFKVYNDSIIGFLDLLLVQLMLKSSQDKRFVCEAAESALIALTSSISPLLLLPKLQPYIKNRNPRIRAKASMCIYRSVARMGAEGIDAYGIDKLIQVGASQLSDQLPESRDAARTLLLELQSSYEKIYALEPTAVSEEPVVASWEHFCQAKLSPLSAQAVLRATSIPREGLLLST